MSIQPYYKQLPIFAVNGLTLRIGAWTFSCGSIDPTDPAYISVNLPTTTIKFEQDANYSKSATLFVTPTFDGVDNYYLTEALNDGLQMQAMPDEKWTPDISLVPCLTITIPKLSEGSAITVRTNEFDPGPAPDSRRDVTHRGLRIATYTENQQPAGWELLDRQKHTGLFEPDPPVSLGTLQAGERWYVAV